MCTAPGVCALPMWGPPLSRAPPSTCPPPPPSAWQLDPEGCPSFCFFWLALEHLASPRTSVSLLVIWWGPARQVRGPP